MEVAPTPTSRPRLRRILIWTGSILGGLLVVGLIAGPPIIGSIARSKLQSILNDRIDGTATVGSVSFSWFSGVTIQDIDLKDRAGAPLASVKSIRADLGFLSVLSGRIVASVTIASPRVDVRRRADGLLNLASAMKPDGAPSTKGPSTTRDLPYLDVTITIQDAVALIVGEKESTRFDISGTCSFKHDRGRVSFLGSTAVKDGAVKIALEADLGDSPTSPAAHASVILERVPLDARMGPILEILHPALSAAGGNLDGTVDGKLSLRHDRPLRGSEDDLLKGMSGTGSVHIQNCTFAGSQLLGQLMAALSTEKRDVKLNPVEFRIADGRIHYDKPWQWTISGSETTFTGSIGLDRTLDMMWHIPVTEELASKLRVAKGQTYEIGIKGTVTRPRLDMKGAIKQVAEEKIEDAAKKGLESLLGGKDEKKAEKLLEEGDALRKEGKTAEAAAKYRKIKDDYRKTRVYKDNKERIDQGAEAK
ncbi:MAG TPA: hypothetical protein VJU16_06365 [Planctomycetota bacterium]|nr:hypothetical protein [Planctomycetota bacterium]